MPARTRQLTVADARHRIAAAAIARSGDAAPGGANAEAALVGVELEWLTIPERDPAAYAPHSSVDDELVTRSLPAGGQVTFEPGGQLELSTRPRAGVGAACAAAETDATTLHRRLARRDIALVGLGLDPLRRERRVVRTERYNAMESYFDRFGPDGRRMMCSTAAVQVNVALGATDDASGRWQRLHAAAPVLAAAFSNSPLRAGEPSGWRSARLATWLAMDPSRTVPVGGVDPASAWADYALAARVMFTRHSDNRYVLPAGAPSLHAWIERGSREGWPTLDDVDYHLTTLFPPVRPRGWVELRVIDALPDPWWRAAVAVTAAVADARAARDVDTACSLTRELWVDAARHGMSHPLLSTAARRLFHITRGLLPDLGGDAPTADVLDEFCERYVDVSRSPADERLAEWTASGSCIPPPHPPRERSRT